MNWTTTLRYARAHLGRPQHADDGAPARIGSLLHWASAPLLRAGAGGALIDPALAADGVVGAISHLRLELDGALWRLHLAPDGDAAAAPRCLQLLLDDKQRVREAMLCQQLAAFVPDADEVAVFRGDSGRGLGTQDYTLWRDDTGALTPARVAAAFGDQDHLDYARDVNPDAVFVAPLQAFETRIDDAEGRRGRQGRVWLMPYARALSGGGTEYLLPQMAAYDSIDGDSTRRRACVEIWLALPLEPDRVDIQ